MWWIFTFIQAVSGVCFLSSTRCAFSMSCYIWNMLNSRDFVSSVIHMYSLEIIIVFLEMWWAIHTLLHNLGSYFIINCWKHCSIMCSIMKVMSLRSFSFHLTLFSINSCNSIYIGHTLIHHESERIEFVFTDFNFWPHAIPLYPKFPHILSWFRGHLYTGLSHYFAQCWV